ncbi:hypothetical protein [Herbaspirillum huttiense]|uniref:hypothetical protein n=1 Tax=Herbaspirillum huttiense TaxID=863372 RepID=UPI000585326B|nr:hypothetical protein [Herbaspirillum huttiense]
MSKLSALIDEARIGLSIQQAIPPAQWDAIAKRCGDREVEEIKERIDALRAELANVEEWDGDTQDEINIAISRFSRLLALIGVNP